MSRQYPRYAGKIRLGERHKPVNCACCDNAAIGYADVQYTWFRSDDEAYPYCEEHWKLAIRDIHAFLSAIKPKETANP